MRPEDNSPADFAFSPPLLTKKIPNERFNLASIAHLSSEVLNFIARGRSHLRSSHTALVQDGVLTDLLVFEPIGALDPAVLGQPRDQKSQQMEQIQDALLLLLKDQIVVKQKPGQSIKEAQADAKKELGELLNALKLEREKHEFGPASVAALQRFEQLFQSRAPKEMQGRLLGADDIYGDGFAEFKRQEALFQELKRRANVYQDQFIELLPLILGNKVQPKRWETKEDARKRILAEIEEQKRELKEERDLGHWGPASRRAYSQYHEWYVEQTRAAVTDLRRQKLPLPAVNPLRLLLGWAEIPEHPDLFLALYAAGDRNSQKKNDPARALESEFFTDFQATKAFLDLSSAMSRAAHLKVDVQLLKDLIALEKLPPGWLDGADENPSLWVDTTSSYINVAIRARRLIQLADHLNQANKNGGGAPNIPMPPGVIFDSDENGHPARNEDGSLKGFRLGLAADSRMRHPFNDLTYSTLKQWCDDNESTILVRIGDYRAAHQHPDLALTFGNFECHGKLARINAQGKYCGLADPNDPMEPGEKRAACNLICGRTRVVDEGGKKYIVQTIEAWDINKYIGYQNWIGDKVASDGPKKTELDPNKIYMVLSGEELIPVPGSCLQHELLVQEAKLRAEQLLVPLMDAALVISGIGEGLTALRAARALGRTEFVMLLAKSGLRITAGGAGVFNSAGGRDTEFGRAVNHARTVYFVCDIVNGWRSSAGLLKTTELPGVVPTATKLEEAAQSCPWLYYMNRGSGVALKVTEHGFIPYIVRDVKKVGDHALASIGFEDRDHLRDASLVLGDGLGFTQANKGCFDLRNALVLQQEVKALERYRDALLDSCPNEESRKQITEILDEARELLKPGADPERVKVFKLKLLAHFVYSDDPINNGSVLILADNQFAQEFRLWSHAQIRALHDPNKLEGSEPILRDHIKSHRGIIDPNVRAAAGIALLTLCRDDDGKLPNELTDTRVHFAWEGRGKEAIKPSYLIRLLLMDLKPPTKRDYADLPGGTNGHRVVVGEFLTRLSVIKGDQFAVLLQDVLDNPNSSSADKMRALTDPISPRLATIMDGLRQATAIKSKGGEAEKLEALKLKATVESLERTLEKRAREDKDPDVRAMATMLLFGLNHPDRVAAEKILEQNNARWQALADKPPGTYAREVREFLETECKREIPQAKVGANDPKQALLDEQKADLARAERLNAALRLADLTDKDDTAGQKKIAEVIASCISPTNVSLSVRVLEQLLPDRIKLLDPASAKAVREQALALLNVPKVEGLAVTPEQEKEVTATVVLVKQLRELLKDANPDLKRTFCTKIENMIDPREVCRPTMSDKLYDTLKETLKPKGSLPSAHLFSELQVVAIDTLTMYGCQTSIPLIKAQLVGETKIGKETHIFSDAPAVRCAAVKALKELSPGELRDILPALIRKEFNPTVSQELRNAQVDLPTLEPEPLAQKQQNLFEKAAKQYTGDKPLPVDANHGPYLIGNDDYKLLNNTDFCQTAKKAAEDAKYGWWRRQNQKMIWSSGNDEKTDIMQAVAKVDQDRSKQKHALALTARTSREAKADLEKIITNPEIVAGVNSKTNEDLIGTGHLTGNVHEWKKWAAEQLVECLKNGGDKQITFLIIKRLLESKHVDAETKLILLDGFCSVLRSSDALVAQKGREFRDSKEHQDQFGFSREELAEFFDKTLESERELATKGDGSRDRFRKALYVEYLKYAHEFDKRPISRAGTLFDPSDELKRFMRRSLDEYENGVDRFWDRIPANQVGTSQERVNHVLNALKRWAGCRGAWHVQHQEDVDYFRDRNPDRNAPKWDQKLLVERDEMVQVIIRSYKGCRFSNPNDPFEEQGLKVLSALLDDKDEKIRLTVAHVLLESWLPITDPTRQKAITECIKIASRRDDSQACRDAVANLRRERFHPNASVEECFKLLTDQPLQDQRRLCRVLFALSADHPDGDVRTKCSTVLKKFYDQSLADVLSGKLIIDGKQLSLDDPLVQMLSNAMKASQTTEQERLNAATLWFAVNHNQIRTEAFANNLKVLSELASQAKSPEVKASARRLMVESLRSEWTNMVSTDAPDSPVYKDSIARQVLVIKALSVIDESECVNALKTFSTTHTSEQVKDEAASALANITILRIVPKLQGDLAPGTRVGFEPITTADDVRIKAFTTRATSDEDPLVRLACVYALLNGESSGVPDDSRQEAYASLARLRINRNPEVQKISIRLLDNVITPNNVADFLRAADWELRQTLLSRADNRYPQPIPVNMPFGDVASCCELFKTVYERAPKDAAAQFRLTRLIIDLQSSPYGGYSEVAQLARLLARDMPKIPLTGDDDARLTLLNCRWDSIRLATAVEATKDGLPLSANKRNSALVTLADLAINCSNPEVRDQASKVLDSKLVSDNKAVSEALLRIELNTARVDLNQDDRMKIVRCLSTRLKLYERTGIPTDSEEYLLVAYRLRVAEGRKDEAELLRNRIFDMRKQYDKSPEIRFSDDAVPRLKAKLEKLPAEGVDACRIHLGLATVLFSQAQTEKDEAKKEELLTSSEEHTVFARDRFKSKFGPKSSEYAHATYRLGLIKMAQGKLDDAEKLLFESVTIISGAGNQADPPEVAWLRSQLAQCYSKQAAQLLKQDKPIEAQGKLHKAEEQAAELLKVAKQPAQSEEGRQAVTRALDITAALLHNQDYGETTFETEKLLLECLLERVPRPELPHVRMRLAINAALRDDTKAAETLFAASMRHFSEFRGVVRQDEFAKLLEEYTRVQRCRGRGDVATRAQTRWEVELKILEELEKLRQKQLDATKR
jgi:hypothetical protein